MPKYEVVSSVKLAGQVHKPGGEPIELTERQAEPAVKSGSLKPFGVVVPPTQAPPKRLNAKEMIEAVQAAANVEALDKLVEGEDRTSVLAAIDKRRAELAG